VSNLTNTEIMGCGNDDDDDDDYSKKESRAGEAVDTNTTRSKSLSGIQSHPVNLFCSVRVSCDSSDGDVLISLQIRFCTAKTPTFLIACNLPRCCDMVRVMRQ
jgi:hypothetical protein